MTVHVFYECCICHSKHPGTEHTPDSARMIPGPKKHEWVFVCTETCSVLAPSVSSEKP